MIISLGFISNLFLIRIKWLSPILKGFNIGDKSKLNLIKNFRIYFFLRILNNLI